MRVPGPEEIRGDVLALFSPSCRPSAPGAVGIELEVIPIISSGDGAARPIPIVPPVPGGASLTGFLSEHARATERVAADWDERGTPRYRTHRQGFVRFEPGGQIEYSTEARPTASAAIADVEAVMGDLMAAARPAGVEIHSRGLNPFLKADQVELELPTARYLAMDEHFTRLGPYGRRMMRLTASMQVNLDFGDPNQAHSRWAAANLLVPVCTAMFANSPVPTATGVAVSGRALIWESTDPTRTGLAWNSGPGMHEAPWSAYTVFALTAEAMLHLDGAGAVVAAPPGLPFKEWWAGLHGAQPSQADWRMHLTTLFPDVRPRGWIELRSIDTPGPEWWAVPPTLIAAILYDDRALIEVLDVLRPLADRISDLNRSAARVGLRDPALGRVAEEVFDIGLTAARRFPAGYFAADGIAACERFRERYVSAHSMQADDHEPGIWVD